MAVPKYNELMLPLLEYAGDGAEHSIQKASLGVAQQLSLTEDDINELLPSGGQTRYYNRFTWAKTYLTKAGLLMTTRRGHFQITDRGYNLLSTNPSEINNDILNQFSSFVEFQTASNNKSAEPEPNTDLEKEQTPEEQVDSIHRKLRKTLADELLDTVLDVSPRFFERLVVDLLLAMGYGSSLDSGEHLG
ncbi:MAG: winged helix-turn-helix domain-containing protein, partial [Chloroflexota bacterium]